MKKRNKLDAALETLSSSLTTSAILFAIIALLMVSYVEITANPYEEYTPTIYMHDERYKTPGFLEFVELSKEGKFKDLEPIKKEEVKEEVEEAEEVEEVKKTKKEEPAKSVITDDVELLAQIIYAEESIFLSTYKNNPMMAERVFKLAGSVVVNRSRTHYMGANTIRDVLYTKGQYDSRTKKKVESRQEIPDIVYKWAEELITNGPIGPSNMVFQSEAPQGVFYEQIGNQFFGCLN